MFAQVGIGTVNPTSELEIEAASSGIPALELNPQSTPLGSDMGQIAVIEDKLFMYDAVRRKWLTVESTALQFGYGLSADNQILRFGGDVALTNSGALMPYNGTIVCVTAKSSGGNSTKRMRLMKNGANIANNVDPNLSGRFNLTNGAFALTTYNLDFNAGDYLAVRATGNGAAVNDPIVIVWVKWRI